uniref:Centromere protein C n=1 Tax=Strigops habroptila TaxID=2489341 RepID=A0A672URA4_STRHB
MQSTAGLANSVKRAFNSSEPLPASPLKPVNKSSHESPLKPVICDYVADSKTPESPVPTRKTNDILKDVEALCTSPAMSLDPEDDHGSLVSPPLLAEEAKGPPVHTCSASISLLSPPPVEHQDIENECDFFIEESHDVSFNSFFSIPRKNKKSRKASSATPVSKFQPSEKNTEGKKGKNRKVHIEALTKQKMDDLNVRIHELKGTSESDSVSDREGKVLKSQRQDVTHREKEKTQAKKGKNRKEKDTSWKPEARKPMLSQSGLETKACDAEQCKTMVMPSEDSLMSSAGHQQERTPSPKKNLKSAKNPWSASKASQYLVHKKQSVKQKHPRDTVAKKLTGSPRKKLKKPGKKSSDRKPRLQTEEISHRVYSEEELESEPVKLDEVFTSPLHQKLETSVIQNLAKSEKPKNVLQTLESLGDANNKTPVKALQHLTDSVKNSAKKQLSAKSSGKIPKKSHCRNSEGVCSGPEDNESQMDSDSSSVQKITKENHKLSDVKIKSNKRKRSAQHGLHGLILEHCDKFASRSQSCEQDNVSSVMPSNTPNVRRTKRLRLRPLEYWRGERVNYTMRPSVIIFLFFVMVGFCFVSGHEIPANLDHSLADTSKPTVVMDPVTSEEVLLECVNTERNHACFFKDESVEIYKNLNTSAFATGRLILKPFKEKGHQFVHMDTIAFHIICGKVIVTLHKTSYYLTTGDFFYVPAGNGYNIRNLLNKESVLLFTQLKKDR